MQTIPNMQMNTLEENLSKQLYQCLLGRKDASVELLAILHLQVKIWFESP